MLTNTIVKSDKQNILRKDRASWKILSHIQTQINGIIPTTITSAAPTDINADEYRLTEASPARTAMEHAESEAVPFARQREAETSPLRAPKQ